VARPAADGVTRGHSGHGRRALTLLVALWIPPAVAADTLPATADREFVTTHCTICHGIERVLGSGGGIKSWQDRIQRMVRWGAKVPPEYVATLAQYLAQALPPRARPPAGPAFFANITVGAVEYRSLQPVLRGAGVLRASDGIVRITVEDCMSQSLRTGMRARVTPGAEAGAGTMAVVESVRQQDARCLLDLRIGASSAASRIYRAEVQVDSGVHLSIPNSSILEDDAGFRVFVQRADGAFEARAVRLGLQDEHYTAVLAGLRAGEQVVSTGGFFVDADARLHGADAP
jgi:hypothetical protein